MTTKCSKKALLHRVTHIYIKSKILLGLVEVLYRAKEVSFIRHPAVVVCLGTLPHKRKQAEKDNDAHYVIEKEAKEGSV